MVQGQDEHVGPELNVLRLAREEREDGERGGVHNAPRVVLMYPKGVEAQCFGQHGLADQVIKLLKRLNRR